MAKAPIRKPRKKVCLFCQEKITYVDYKDTALLRKFISDRGKIAREMAMLPYTSTPR